MRGDRDMTTTPAVDTTELEAKVKQMYRAVAQNPHGSYHFELGRDLAERLGYPAPVLDQIPAGAAESFAGVGYFFDLAELKEGEDVLDLGSGSGMDVFFAALQVGGTGQVVGVDMTLEQLNKAEALRVESGFEHVTFTEGHIDDLPFPDDSFDVVISNGVINLASDKRRVFAEAARVLRPGGRLAIADIIAEVELNPQIVGKTDLWASCIGGAYPTGRVSAGHGSRRAAPGAHKEERVRILVRAGPQDQREVRGEERLRSRPKA
jgi:SAM-dependent methyltransferase